MKLQVVLAALLAAVLLSGCPGNYHILGDWVFTDVATHADYGFSFYSDGEFTCESFLGNTVHDEYDVDSDGTVHLSYSEWSLLGYEDVSLTIVVAGDTAIATGSFVWNGIYSTVRLEGHRV